MADTSRPRDDEALLAVDRVVAASELRTNPRQAKLLRYLVTEAVEGRADRLKGTSIAMDVFGRGADFDPRMDAVVRSEARRLRHALASYYVGPGASDPIVVSIPKGGYAPTLQRRTAPDQPGPAADAPPPADTPTAVPDPPRTGRQHRSGWRLGAMAVLATCVVVGLGLAGRATFEGAAPLRSDPQASLASSPSVLVLPLVATGSLVGVDTLASGITAQLIADLMRFPGFRLYDYDDSLSAGAGAGGGPQTATGKPTADFLVRGVLSGDAETLSLAMRLIDTSNDQVVWSEGFSRPLSPQAITEMQADISGEIAAKLGDPFGVIHTRFTPTAGAQNAGMASFSCVMDAYTYRYTNRSDLYAPARACLEATVLRDPSYAEAWAMLANLRLDGGRFGYDGGSPEDKTRAFAGARAAAGQALSLEPENVTATSALAMIEHYAGNFDESLAYSRRAVELNPNDPSTLGYHGWRLVARGHLKEGIPFVEKAIDRSVKPQPMLFHTLAVERLMAGDMQGMLSAAQRASADQSAVSDAFLAIAYGGLGLQADASAALARMAQKWPLLAKDPAAAFGWHNLHPDLIAAIVAGLEKAGWTPPVATATVSAASDKDVKN